MTVVTETDVLNLLVLTVLKEAASLRPMNMGSEITNLLIKVGGEAQGRVRWIHASSIQIVALVTSA
jgi:hypothetical protein